MSRLRRRRDYFLAFLPAFFGEAFFLVAGPFFAADLVPDLPALNAVSQPSAYFAFVPTRVIVTFATFNNCRNREQNHPSRQPPGQPRPFATVSKYRKPPDRSSGKWLYRFAA